jgi:signal transduction histidine kinase
MKTLSKQYAAVVTAWRYNKFFKARIQLTLFYVLMVANILAVFSGFIFFQVNQDLRTHDELELSEERHGEFSEMFLEEFGENLIMADVLILLVFGALSYFLAGQTLRPIESMLRQHEAFSGNVAHELRTPLAALYATTSATLRNPATTAEYIETLEDVHHETQRLISLTEQLLKTTQYGSLHTREPVVVGAVAERVVAKMEALAAVAHVRLVCTTESLSIVGDVLALEELFFNLIHNAIKFSHPEGVVEVSVSKKGMITVMDHGVGIKKEALPHITNRFYTTDTARDERGIRGTGLGLAIVSQIVAQHEGSLSIASEAGSGTTITIVFPVHTSAL